MFKFAVYGPHYITVSCWLVLLLLLLSVTASLCIPSSWRVTLLCSLSVSECSLETSGSTQRSDSGSDPKITVSSVTQHWKPPEKSLSWLQIRWHLLFNYASNLLCVVVAQWEWWLKLRAGLSRNLGSIPIRSNKLLSLLSCPLVRTGT
jgi:hypothetical protein